jgi:four helix bundle protein
VSERARGEAIRLGSDIAERLLELAAGALRISAELPSHPSGRHVALQLARAGTGGGANYEEARAAESRSDFIHKVGIACKEVRETAYWLTVIRRAAWRATKLEDLISEAFQLAAILSASARTARANARKQSS